jgi:hypothetical protein
VRRAASDVSGGRNVATASGVRAPDHKLVMNMPRANVVTALNMIVDTEEEDETEPAAPEVQATSKFRTAIDSDRSYLGNGELLPPKELSFIVLVQ